MNAIACIGSYAKVPYYFEKLDIRVYCMEELCRCLKENAFLLGTEILNEGLLKFISNECELPQLARELYPLVHKKGNVSTFVSMLFEYVGFYSAEETKQVETILKQGAHLPDYEKQKIQIDYLAEKKKYGAALEAYQRLYEGMPKNQKAAQVLHNMGVMYANMMMYERAGDFFWQSYEIGGSKDSFIAYLGAKRFELTDREYVDYVAELKQHYELEMELEKMLEHVNDTWEASSGYLGIQNMREWRQEGRVEKYEEECRMVLDNLKNDYRSSAQV